MNEDLNKRMPKVNRGGNQEHIADHKGKMITDERAGIGARSIFIAFLTTSSICVSAQSDTREFAMDTTISERHYTLAVANDMGQLIAFGNRDKAGERHGWWHEYAPDSTLVLLSEYHHGSMVHTHWGNGEVWRYDKKGRIISKGKADRRAKTGF